MTVHQEERDAILAKNLKLEQEPTPKFTPYVPQLQFPTAPMPIFEEPNQNETVTVTSIQDSISSGRPTLKDYLNSMKEKNGEFSYQQKNSNNSETDMIVPQLQQFPTAPISHQQHEVQQPNSTNLFRYKNFI